MPSVGLTAPRREQAAWWTAFVSLSSMILQNPLGNKGMAICLGVWVLYAAAYPITAARSMRAYMLPWLLPAFALASVLWSIEPQISLRLGVELIVFTGIGFLTAGVLTPLGFMSVFLCSLMVGVVASAVFGGHAVIGTTGENAMIGLFGSKNNFATYICMMMIAALGVLPDRRQPGNIRLLALCAMGIGPVLLVKTISLGALLAGGGSLAAVAGVLVLATLPARLRAVVVVFGLVFAVLLGGIVLLAVQGQGQDSMSQLLVSAGKDPSLTGRTYLWQRAAQYIQERPVFGLGYQSFWVQGHVEAEGLWEYAKITDRMGFHFHNLYYETAVELGMTGVLLLGLSLVVLAGKILVWAVRLPGPCSAFFLGLTVFFAMRVGVELDFLGPFSPGSFLLPVMWAYSTRALQAKAQSPIPAKA